MHAITVCNNIILCVFVRQSPMLMRTPGMVLTDRKYLVYISLEVGNVTPSFMRHKDDNDSSRPDKQVTVSV